MPVFNYPKKEVNVKVVYYGPGLSGKTTNLQKIHEGIKPDFRGKLISLATQTDRTLFFDFMPMDLGSLGGYKIRLHLYTVPGQVHYNATRKLVLKGVDGIVFVADSQKAMGDANIESVMNLEKNLQSYGKSLSGIPHVIQANKRDLEEVLSIDEIDSSLNHYTATVTEAVASEGRGVLETLTEIVRQVMKELRGQFSSGTNRYGEPATRPAHEPPSASTFTQAADKPRSDTVLEEEVEGEAVPPAEESGPQQADGREAVADNTEPAGEPEEEVELEPVLDPAQAEAAPPAAPDSEPVSPEDAADGREPESTQPVKLLIPLAGVGTVELSLHVKARMLEEGEVRSLDVDAGGAFVSANTPVPDRDSDLSKAPAADGPEHGTVDQPGVETETAFPPSPDPESVRGRGAASGSQPATRRAAQDRSEELNGDLPPLGGSANQPLGAPLDGEEVQEMELPDLTGTHEKIMPDDEPDTEGADASRGSRAPETEPGSPPPPPGGYDPGIQPVEMDFRETAPEEAEPVKRGLFGRRKKR